MELKIEKDPYGGYATYLANPSKFIQSVVNTFFDPNDIMANHLVCQANANLTECNDKEVFIEFGKDREACQNLVNLINKRLSAKYRITYANSWRKDEPAVDYQDLVEIIKSYSNTPEGTLLQLEAVAEYTGMKRPFIIEPLGRFVVNRKNRKQVKANLHKQAEKGLGLLSEKHDWLVLKWGKNTVIISLA